MLWSILFRTEIKLSLIICDWPIGIVLAPANDNGCHFGHHCQWWASNSSKQQVAVELN